jgi:hypothetical protein
MNIINWQTQSGLGIIRWGGGSAASTPAVVLQSQRHTGNGRPPAR